jgi:hypothetical protein
VDVVADVVKAEGAGRVARDRLRAILPARGVVRERLRRFVSPGKLFLLEAAAGGEFPFGFGGQAVDAARLAAEPLALAHRFVPGDSGDWLLGLAEIWVLAEWWRKRGSRTQK